MADVSSAETVLALLKADLGVTHTKRDEYFAALIAAAAKMLRTEGIVLDLSDQGDQLLLEMYAAHLHERRQQPTMATCGPNSTSGSAIRGCRAKVQHAGVPKLDTPAKEGDVCTMM